MHELSLSVEDPGGVRRREVRGGDYLAHLRVGGGAWTGVGVAEVVFLLAPGAPNARPLPEVLGILSAPVLTDKEFVRPARELGRALDQLAVTAARVVGAATAGCQFGAGFFFLQGGQGEKGSQRSRALI